MIVSSLLVRTSRVLLLSAVGCSTPLHFARAQNGPQMPPPPVSVMTVIETTVPVLTELPGRVAATRVSEVRARVSGILQERLFEQGKLVSQGEVLYRIDPALFQARVASAEATLQRAVATQENARLQLTRQKMLRERNVSAVMDFDTAAVTLAQAEADVGQAKAALDEAKINLSYTEVRAPITGIIGGALVTEGALVTAEGSQNLALIQQIDPVYADFTQSASDLLKLKRSVQEGKMISPAEGAAGVELVFDDGTIYQNPGRLLFSSASVDASTGQVTLRGEFPNPNGDLLPGMYVRIRIEQAVRPTAITVPQRAVVRNPQGGAKIYVLTGGDTVEPRDVELGQTMGGNWIVETGLKAGDQVVVDGTMKVQPGDKVAAEPLNAAVKP